MFLQRRVFVEYPSLLFPNSGSSRDSIDGS